MGTGNNWLPEAWADYISSWDCGFNFTALSWTSFSGIQWVR
jgi:hypothetical protein